MIGGFQPGAFQTNFQQQQELIGRRPRRYKTKIWPDWTPDEDKEEDREWLRLQTQIEALQADRVILIADLNKTLRASELGLKRLDLVRKLRLQRDETDAELARLRMRRQKQRKIIEELLMIEEDEFVISFVSNELLN